MVVELSGERKAPRRIGGMVRGIGGMVLMAPSAEKAVRVGAGVFMVK